jgi:chromosome segregation ATPase
MGSKKRKKYGLRGNDLAARAGAGTSAVDGETPENLVTAAWKALGSKYGNFASAVQKSIAADQPNSLELPSSAQNANRAPELGHPSTRSDSQQLEQQQVAKKNDYKKNPLRESRPAELPAPVLEAPASRGGFLKRLFGGSSKPSNGGGDQEDPTGPMITLFTGRLKAGPPAEPPKAETPKAGATAVKSVTKATEEPSTAGTPTEETLQKFGELDRLREENASLKKNLNEERLTAQKQLGQLEIQNNELRLAADKTRGEKGDVEARTAVLRKSVTALERQLAEEREHFHKELEQSARQRDTLLQDVAELNEKVMKLEAEIEAATASSARSTSTGLSSEIGASHAHISRLESLVQRLEDEVELLQRELATEKEKFRRNNDEWEEKYKKFESAASRANAERSRIEGSASLVQAAIDALEQQVREQSEAMEVQMKLIESERAQARTKATEYQQKLKAVEAQLEAERARHLTEQDSDSTLTAMETALTETRTHSTLVEARIALLEGELEAARDQVLKEAKASSARIKKFEKRWEEIQQQIVPKDEELQQLRPQVSALRAQVGSLEAELKNAKAAVARLAASADGDGSVRTMVRSGDPTFAQTGVRLPAEVAEPLYHQSMAPITVMLACADILGMSRKLDPSLKSTADEFKTQTQLLLDLIKSYTLPPDSKTN